MTPQVAFSTVGREHQLQQRSALGPAGRQWRDHLREAGKSPENALLEEEVVHFLEKEKKVSKQVAASCLLYAATICE